MLLGRDEVAAELAAAVADDRPVALVGEAGIGKTSLMRAVAARSGRPAFEGGALATLSWLPYLALERALGERVEGADAVAVAAEVERRVGAGLLIVDDLQWAHPASVDVVELLAGRVALLVAVRSDDPAAEALRDRLRAAGVEQCRLPGLEGGPAAALVRELRPDLPGAAVEALVGRSGGNPLLLTELARTGEPSQSLRLAVAARLRLLGPAAAEAFTFLSLAGRPLPPESTDKAAVDLLVDAGLLERGPAGVGVRHPVLAEIAADLAGEDERRRCHVRLADELTDPGEKARHYLLAGLSDRAHHHALEAAAAATRAGERAEHLAVAAAAATRPEANAVRLAAARALAEAHDWPRLVATLDGLHDPDPETGAWADLLRARGAWAQGEVETLRSALDRGLGTVGDELTEIAVLLRVEQCRLPIFVDPDRERAVEMGRDALALAERVGAGVARARYILGTALSLADRPGWDEQLRLAVAGAREAGDVDTEFSAASNLLTSHESGGSPEYARTVADAAAERARRLGFGEWTAIFRAMKVNLDFHLGRNADAVSAALELLDGPIERRSADMLVEAMGLALVDLGRIDEAVRRVEAHLDRAIPDYRGRDSLQIVLAEAAFWGGDPKRALAHAEAYLTALEGDPLNQAFGHVVRAWACLELGRDPGPVHEPPARAMLAAVPPELRAVGAAFHGDHAAAAQRFADAALAWAPYHRRGELRCRWAAAESLRRAGRVEDAVEQLRRLEHPAGELGYLPLLGRIHRSLRAAGVRRAAPRTRAVAGLTGREREVIDLVAAGHTDAQIAARLGISRRTVLAHIASVSAKLGAATRGQAVALARSATP